MQNASTSNRRFTNLFLWIGKLEGYSYLLLLFVAMPLKYFYGKPEWVRVVGMLHGILFVAFGGILLVMMTKANLSFKNAAFSFLLSLVPFGTFYLKRLVR